MKKLITLAAFSLGFLAIYAQIPTDGLVAYYPFNGNANDESGNGNNGSVNGATLTTDRFGNQNSAYSFDGINDYISVPTSASLTFDNHWTLAGWVYLQSNASWRQIFWKSEGTTSSAYKIHLRTDISGYIQAYEGCNSLGVYGNILQLNTWYFVALTSDGTIGRIYVDATLVGSDASVTNPCNNYEVEIGRDPNFTDRNWHGKIDDVRFYNRALSENEILELYNESQSWSCGSPITYEGQQYNTVQIGTQCWMAENLNVGIRINGSLEQSDNSMIEKYCYNDLESNCGEYGGLYQWNEFMNYSPSSDTNPSGVQGICLGGWHIPSKSEWNQFIDLQGGLDLAGGAMKETGIVHWNLPNTGATNSSGFTALGTGGRYIDGLFYQMGTHGAFGSSSDGSYYGVWSPTLYNTSTAITWGSGDYANNGFPVRCIKDPEPIGLNSDFSATPLEGVAPLTVQFTDESTGNPSVWIWDFQNDGVNDAFIQNPTITYEEAGEYSVRLIVINATETDTLVKENYITVNPASPQEGLVAYYPFNGNADDESGYGNDGTVYGAILTMDRFGNANSAYQFNSNYILTPFDEVLGGSSRTMCIWASADNFTIDPTILINCGNLPGGTSKFTGVIRQSPSAHGVAIDNDGSRITYQSDINIGEWHFYTWVLDSTNGGATISNVQLYKDGVLLDNVIEYYVPFPAAGNINTQAGLAIGGSYTALNYWFFGKLDDIRIYDRALADDEILELYNESQITTPESVSFPLPPMNITKLYGRNR